MEIPHCDDEKNERSLFQPDTNISQTLTPPGPPSAQILTPSPSPGSPYPSKELDVFRWRSPRQRVATNHFSAEDFRETGRKKGKVQPRNSPRRKKEKVQPQNFPQRGKPGEGVPVVRDVFSEEERVKRQEELSALRRMQLDSLR